MLRPRLAFLGLVFISQPISVLGRRMLGSDWPFYVIYTHSLLLGSGGGGYHDLQALRLYRLGKGLPKEKSGTLGCCY